MKLKGIPNIRTNCIYNKINIKKRQMIITETNTTVYEYEIKGQRCYDNGEPSDMVVTFVELCSIGTYPHAFRAVDFVAFVWSSFLTFNTL